MSVSLEKPFEKVFRDTYAFVLLSVEARQVPYLRRMFWVNRR